jgi:hypothetical protein
VPPRLFAGLPDLLAFHLLLQLLPFDASGRACVPEPGLAWRSPAPSDLRLSEPDAQPNSASRTIIRSEEPFGTGAGAPHRAHVNPRPG